MRALVLGVNGQDGSYLAEELLAAGYEVSGAGRQERSRHVREHARFVYTGVDLEDETAVDALLRRSMPDAIYHMAAVHGPAGFAYEEKSLAALRVNTQLTLQLLEFMRLTCPAATLTVAGTAKQFGDTPPETVTEASPRRSDCLYSVTKNAANQLMEYYRKRHRIRAGMIYYWNHESPRRPEGFFIPRVVGILASVLNDSREKHRVRSLSFYSDWGSAREYMHLTRLMAEKAPDQDVIMATGRTLSGKELVDALFTRFKKNWRDHILCEQELPDAPPGSTWKAVADKLAACVGRRPRCSIEDVCLEMLNEKRREESLPG